MSGAGRHRDHLKADLALLGVTATWGLTFPAIRQAVAGNDPLLFLVLRFTLTFGLLAALLRGRLFQGWKGRLGAGTLLGLVYFGSCAAQVFGLRYTTAGRSALITGLSVILVPLLYVPIRRRLPGLYPSLGAVLAMAGLFLLTRPDRAALNRGDVITLGCAVTYALYVVLLEKLGAGHPAGPLIGMQAAAGAALSLIGLPLVDWRVPSPRGLGLGLLVTVPVLMFTFVALTRFQPRTTATRAAVIYAAEPVFALFFAAAWLGERLDGPGLLGAALILAGVFTAVIP